VPPGPARPARLWPGRRGRAGNAGGEGNAGRKRYKSRQCASCWERFGPGRAASHRVSSGRRETDASWGETLPPARGPARGPARHFAPKVEDVPQTLNFDDENAIERVHRGYAWEK